MGEMHHGLWGDGSWTPLTVSEGLAQCPYVAAGAEFEPTTLRSKGSDSTNAPPHPHNVGYYGPYVAARAGFEPTSLRSKGSDFTNAPNRLHSSLLGVIAGGRECAATSVGLSCVSGVQYFSYYLKINNFGLSRCIYCYKLVCIVRGYSSDRKHSTADREVASSTLAAPCRVFYSIIIKDHDQVKLHKSNRGGISHESVRLYRMPRGWGGDETVGCTTIIMYMYVPLHRHQRPLGSYWPYSSCHHWHTTGQLRVQ